MPISYPFGYARALAPVPVLTWTRRTLRFLDWILPTAQEAWQLWPPQSTVLINHYGLNLRDPAAQKFLMEQLEEFFFGEGAQLPADWVPEGEGQPGPRKK